MDLSRKKIWHEQILIDINKILMDKNGLKQFKQDWNGLNLV
jgi:hypothetical protein